MACLGAAAVVRGGPASKLGSSTAGRGAAWAGGAAGLGCRAAAGVGWAGSDGGGSLGLRPVGETWAGQERGRSGIDPGFPARAGEGSGATGRLGAQVRDRFRLEHVSSS